MFYFIGVSDVIQRHVATVPQNNDPSVAKALIYLTHPCQVAI